MKKAKITLAVIILSSLAGGVYALKSKRASDKIYCTTYPGGLATVTINYVTLLAIPLQSTLGFTYATTIYNSYAGWTLAPYYRGL